MINKRFQIQSRLGGGQQGQVFEVCDTRGPGRFVAKIVAGVGADDRHGVAAEFLRLRELASPALPKVYAAGQLDVATHGLPVGSPYFVAEFIEGKPLADLAPISDVATLCRIIRDLAEALAALHEAGILHRDISPQNAMVRADGRTVLIDLGLASDAGVAGNEARGTVSYLAPEALAGNATAASDLYSVGAVLWHAVRGNPPFTGDTVAQKVTRIVSEIAPALTELPTPLANLLASLLEKRPERRPGSALQLRRSIEAIAAGLGVEFGPVTGATQWKAPYTPALEVELVLGRLDKAAITLVCGAEAIGVAELAAEVAARRRGRELSHNLAPARIGTLAEIGRELSVEEVTGEPASRTVARVVTAVLASGAPTLLMVDPSLVPTALAAAMSMRPSAALVLAAELEPTPDVPAEVTVVTLSRVTLATLSSWIEKLSGTTPPAAWLQALATCSDGLPAVALELLRAARATGAPFDVELASNAGAVRLELTGRWLAAANDDQRGAAVYVALLGGGSSSASAADIEPVVLDELLRAGLVSLCGTRYVMPALVAEAVIASVDRRQLLRVAVHLTNVAAQAGDLRLVARVARYLPKSPDRDRRLVVGANLAVEAGDPGEALEFASLAAGGEHDVAAAAVAARAALASGQWDDAIRFSEIGNVPLVAAQALQRQGLLDEADAAFAKLADSDDAAAARARICISRGDFAAAQAISGPVDDAHGHAGRIQATGLAALYLGDQEVAEHAFATLVELAGGDEVALARATALQGMAAQRRGELRRAASYYGAAGTHARAAGEVLAAAIADANRGIALTPLGRGAEAVTVLASAGRVLAALGARAELASAEFNRGTALFTMAQFDSAQTAALRASEVAPDSEIGQVYAPLLRADVARRRGELAVARTLAERALGMAVSGEAKVAAVVALWEAGGTEPAVAAAMELADNSVDRDKLIIADARRRLATDGDSDAAGIAASVLACAERDRANERLDAAWRGFALAAKWLTRAGDLTAAATHGARAMALHDELIALADPAWRVAMQSDPDRPAATQPAPRPATDERELEHLRRMAALSRRLVRESRLAELLDEVLDAAIEITRAERGFVLFVDGDGPPTVAVARNFDARALDGDGAAFSRSIAAQAAASGEPVMTIDAGDDARWDGAGSIAALRLRSVLAAPLRNQDGPMGCVYVDHRLRRGAFDELAALRLCDLADVAAIAIGNARLADDLRKRSAEANELGARLATELADREAELVRARADLHDDRARLRNPYPAIVGQSPALITMLDRVDRAAATALPVVLVGESGTGKELIARALHDHGPRAPRSFVAINCGAMPETLLESELFGHARGAFTGAERERCGLFEVATGGTLFLDEIADTSLAMQGRLLRVLQEGLVRRVGEHHERKVDVRVIAATQRPLAELVAAGRFRDDLRYRLEVIPIEIPPLRERAGDVAILTAALLARIAPDRKVTVSRSAARVLAQHSWPGNVRELENALARALALGGDSLEIGDFPEQAAATASVPTAVMTAGRDLKLRPAVDALEGNYIAAALDRAKGNQTVAARLLGLSRFGLQKKLKRMADDDRDAVDSDDDSA